MAIFNTVPPLAAGPGIKFDGERISTAAAPRNWLDNSDFTNLVAQAGIGGKHGNVAYAADRWKLTSGTVTYTAGTGLKLNGTITQVLKKAPTGGSCFVGMASGTATIALNGNIITITSSGGVIKWAALYAEEYTEATKPEYQPKGYGAELAECQLYYQKIEGESWGLGASPYGAGGILIPLAAKYPMRTTHVSAAGSVDAFSKQGWQGAKTPSVDSVATGYVARVNVLDGYEFGSTCLVKGSIELIADL